MADPFEKLAELHPEANDPYQPYSGVSALFNGDLHLGAPWYMSRQDWMVVSPFSIGEIPKYQIRTPGPDYDLESVLELRHTVLDPAKKTPTELDVSRKDRDPSTIHAAAFVGGVAVSTVRLDVADLALLAERGMPTDEKTYLVRKMATAEVARRRGIGGKVLEYAEQQAVERGAQTILLDARKDAVSFYESHGYVLTGQEVMHNDGIPNFSMIKKVADGK